MGTYRFLDTPGYSKADAEHHHHSDEKLAINQLSKADYLIWLVNAKNGTIRDEDLQFLQKSHQKNLFLLYLPSRIWSIAVILNRY